MTNNPYIYSLSLAVYCTAWLITAYIGVAVDSGLLPNNLFRSNHNYPNLMISLKELSEFSRVNKTVL
jgi:hypothetical protein